MSEGMKSIQGAVCPQCENHCPAEALRCGRGRKFFGVEEKDRGHGHSGTEPGGLADLLRRSGRFVRHADVEEETLFQPLTGEEKAALRALLEKLNTGWRAQFGEKALSRGHHHHGHDDGHHKHGGHKK